MTTEKRRRLALVQSVRHAHGGEEGNDEPTVAGLFYAVIYTATPDQLDAIERSPIMMQQVMPRVTNAYVARFNASRENSVRSIVAMYRNGVLSKRKYEALAICLHKQYSDSVRRTVRLHLCPGVTVERLLTYKQVMQQINAEDIGELLPLPVVQGRRAVLGLHRPLKSLAAIMVEMFTSNARLRNSLTWFGQPNTLFYAVGGDGAPKGDDNITLWTVSLANRQRRVASPHDNFLLVVTGCEEDHPVMLAYARSLSEQIEALDPDGVTVGGTSYTCKCSLLPVDMKYLAKLSGELPNSASYFSSFANVSNATKRSEDAVFCEDSTADDNHKVVWTPWKWETRLTDVAAVDAFKLKLTGDLESKSNRQKITSFIAARRSRQE